LVFKILKSPHTCKLTFLSMRGPFFTNWHLWNNLKRFFSSNFDPFVCSVLQPSGKSYCFETHFTFQSGNCTCFFYQILSLYLYWFSVGKGFKIALNFSRCSKLFAPTVFLGLSFSLIIPFLAPKWVHYVSSSFGSGLVGFPSLMMAFCSFLGMEFTSLLRCTVFVNASSLEVAAFRDFSGVCDLPLR
jgi:hypothetical protein